MTNLRMTFCGKILLLLIMLLLPKSQLLASTHTWSGFLSGTTGPVNPLSTAITAAKRDLIEIHVSGQIKLGEAPWSGPQGSAYYGFEGSNPPYGYTHGIVMVKIGGTLFPIENGVRTFVTFTAGLLRLYINDDAWGDNLGGFDVTVTTYSCESTDNDEDSLLDQIEDSLLNFYSPEIKFDDNEWRWPMDVYSFLRNSDLLDSENEQSLPLYSRKQVPYFVESFLANQVQDGYTSFLSTPSLTHSFVNIHNERRSGDTPGRVTEAGNIGIYGHAVPTGSLIALQYSLFYPYNDIDAPFDIGDHEGDWELFEVFVDRDNPFGGIKRAVWHAHGGNPSTWDESSGWHIGGGAIAIGAYPSPMPQQHLPIFVEAGSHGSWPTFVYLLGVGGNDGSGITVVTHDIPNVGEIFRPTLGYEVITQFNGRWGAFSGAGQSCPPGPILQDWIPAGPSAVTHYVGKWSHGILPFPLALFGSGTISVPWHFIFYGVGATAPGGQILVYPGSYSETGTFDNACEIVAPYGSVVIGR